MTVTYNLFMLAFTLFSASFVFTACKLGYPILSAISTIVYIVAVFLVESYNQKTYRDNSGSN